MLLPICLLVGAAKMRPHARRYRNPISTSGLRIAGIVLIVSVAYGFSGSEPKRYTETWDEARKRMVDTQLISRDIRDMRLIDAMHKVPRHRFVPPAERLHAYIDSPLPIGYSQTISQPYIVAYMTQALEVRPTHRVLEIGTGSGYQAAVLAELAHQVYTIEIVAPLAQRARETLASLGYRNIHVRTGNGYLGWEEHAPYDRILVTAAPEEVPPALVQQLKIGGLMAIPVGRFSQELKILRRTPDGMETLRTVPVRFVPMTGDRSQDAK
jgi:protein-L-isoaspartate(D-aspartate) O-methyltransferase